MQFGAIGVVGVAVRGPRMCANAPVNPPLPEAKAGNTITLEGRTLEVRVLEIRSPRPPTPPR